LNARFRTLIQRLALQKPESILKADDELEKQVNLGYRVVSEIVLPGDDILTRVIRLEREVLPDTPETVIGQLVQEHGSEGADRVLQQKVIDRARESYEARRAHYRNISIPVPAFPIREDK